MPGAPFSVENVREAIKKLCFGDHKGKTLKNWECSSPTQQGGGGSWKEKNGK